MQKTSHPSIKYSWYQYETHIIINIFAEKIKPSSLTVNIADNRLSCLAKLPDDSNFYLHLYLAHEVHASQIKFKVLSSKIEIRLKKAQHFEWKKLEVFEEELHAEEGNSQSTRDNSFSEFRKLCRKIAEENSYLEKTAIMKEFFTKGSKGDGFKGDLYLWIKLLLPGVEKRVYNLQSKQLIKIFRKIFKKSQDEMPEDLEQLDIAKEIATIFETSHITPCSESTLTLQEVDTYLSDVSVYSDMKERTIILKTVTKRCTAQDLEMFIKFIFHDIKITAGPKPILDAVHPTAYEAFLASRGLKNIVQDILKHKHKEDAVTVQSSLMTPVLPMLAMECGSVSEAFEICPNGFFVEITYNGERVQVHKQGSEFSFFSRSLKPVMPHKVSHFKDFIPKAFPHGKNLIIDTEMLLVNKEGTPLLLGTLGAHSETALKDATVCLYVFDILQFNEENLMNRPLYERREILRKNMTDIKNHVMFSEMKEITNPTELKDIINSVIKQGLEGLVIKDKMSIYEPGKRHWLKVKKDYLKEEDLNKGTMPYTADLVVLGAYYGTGRYGGKKSIFLMGCLDENSGKWCTVTKVSDFTDEELERIEKQLDMIKISKNPDLVPSTMKIKKALVPDFIIRDVEKSPIWEIIGTEFSKADAHTANGISIRFPRVKCVRDKTWKQTTTLSQLQKLYDISKQTADRVGLEVIDNSTDEVNTVRAPDDVLPNLFSGVKLYIPSSVEDADVLRRYFIAYDGVLLKESDVGESNIVIASNEENGTPKNAEKVTVEWLWACIKLKKRLPTKLYKPG